MNVSIIQNIKKNMKTFVIFRKNECGNITKCYEGLEYTEKLRFADSFWKLKIVKKNGNFWKLWTYPKKSKTLEVSKVSLQLVGKNKRFGRIIN
jgi:hypothetical protein